MTAFLRTNRYASVLITMIILVVVGMIVNLTRDDSPSANDVTLRADEQTLQAQPDATLPQNLIDRAMGDIPINTIHPPLTIGTIPRVMRPTVTLAPGSAPAPAPTAKPGGGTTATTQGGTTQTTTAPVPQSAFAQGRIAYSAGATLWTVNPDGSDRRALGVGGYFPAWAKDHSAIAYADADNPGGALYLLLPNGDRIGLTTGLTQDAQPSWSPNGAQLAFARIEHTSQSDYSAIWIVNRSGSSPRKIATPSPCFSRDPAWSPDGKQIAFWSSRDHCGAGTTKPGNYELYVYDVANDEVTRLAPNRSNAGAPAWSPDGRRIAFSCDGEGGSGFEICVIDADGTSLERITDASGDDTDPTWSPDGTRIAFRSDRRDGGIFTMKPDGSDVRLVVPGGSQPHWS